MAPARHAGRRRGTAGGLRVADASLFPTIPRGYEAQVRPRSGLAAKHGITVLNSPGTIDSDYRGEVQVLLINLGDRPFSIGRGERIAQLVVQRVERAGLSETLIITSTRRGAGGFGSTGNVARASTPKRKRGARKAKTR